MFKITITNDDPAEVAAIRAEEPEYEGSETLVDLKGHFIIGVREDDDKIALAYGGTLNPKHLVAAILGMDKQNEAEGQLVWVIAHFLATQIGYELNPIDDFAE